MGILARTLRLTIGLGCAWLAVFAQPVLGQESASAGGKTKIVFVAGPRSHGYAEHEHYAGCMLLAGCLRNGLPNLDTVVCRDGWPKDSRVFDGAAAIVLFSDGGDGNPVLPHLDEIEKLMKRDVGLACLHYAVLVPKGHAGDLLKTWIGGYYEPYWSVNPFWTAEFKTLPNHPITRGVRPFAIEDEWYYHMRFVDGMEGVAPILTATPPDSTRDKPDGPYSGNPTVRAEKGRAEHVAWAYVRPDGGRGFGLTGCHSHWNLANDNFRTVLLNAIAWVAKLDVPADGVPSKTPTMDSLEANQDKPQPQQFDRDGVQKVIQQWNSR